MHAAVARKFHDVFYVGGGIFFGHVVKDYIAVGVDDC